MSITRLHFLIHTFLFVLILSISFSANAEIFRNHGIGVGYNWIISTSETNSTNKTGFLDFEYFLVLGKFINYLGVQISTAFNFEHKSISTRVGLRFESMNIFSFVGASISFLPSIDPPVVGIIASVGYSFFRYVYLQGTISFFPNPSVYVVGFCAGFSYPLN